MRFKKQTMKARDLGRLFGESSHTINDWLIQADLLDKKSKLPTWDARKQGYTQQVTVAGYSHDDWVPERVVPILIEKGHRLVIDLPDDLVHPIALTGPFHSQGKIILNCVGDPVAFLNNPINAEFTCKLMNAAQRAGTIGRFLGGISSTNTTIMQSG